MHTQTTLVVFGLLLLSVAAKQLYPQPSFLRTCSVYDEYSRSYCLEDGSSGIQQGSDSQKYQFVQPCTIGQIGVTQYSGNSSVSFGDIGGVVGAFVDLGTFQNLKTAYNMDSSVRDADILLSIFFDEDKQKFQIIKGYDGKGSVQLQDMNNAVNVLQNTHAAFTNFVASEGHLYLIRTTDGPKTTWDGTTLIAKVQLVGSLTLRWTITNSNQQITPDPEKKSGNESDNAHSVAVAGVVLALLSFIVSAVLLACLLVQKRQNSHYVQY